MTELIWDGKYKDGKKQGPVRIALPFQTIETVNESAQDRLRTLELFAQGRQTEWRNRLVWGDKKYVLPSLLPEFAGKVNLIYIDPPFDTGADFSFTATIPDVAPGFSPAGAATEARTNAALKGGATDAVTFTKEPSILEQKAYRDTWGRGLDSYLLWFYEAALLLRELLVDGGSIYVHMDWKMAHYVKCALDEVMGPDKFISEIIWHRSTAHNNPVRYGPIHDVILYYTNSDTPTWNFQYTDYDKEYIEGHFSQRAADGRLYRINEVTGSGLRSGDSGRPWREYDPSRRGRHWAVPKILQQKLQLSGTSQQMLDELDRRGYIEWGKGTNNWPRLRYFKEEMRGVVLQDIWRDIYRQSAPIYPTEKPEALLDRIIKASSNEGDLVLDCFCGSGTTAAVAEKLNRRWIACDLGRFAIHTTRKRLLGIPGVKPFVVQNLGKYERQAWQVAEFGVAPGFSPARAALKDGATTAGAFREQQVRELAYRKFVLDLYHATPVTGYLWLHGTKAGRMVHVGAVDAPVTLADVKAIAKEVWKSVGAGLKPAVANSGEERAGQRPAPTTNGADILGWEFAFELNETAKQTAAESRVNVSFKKIPHEALDKKAADQGDVKFFELGALSVDVKVKKREVKLTLEDFAIPIDDIPIEVRKAIKHWSQLVDYWAVDWDYKDDTFHNQWQSYRTRKDPKIELNVSYVYPEPGKHTIVVKVIDILGNDTTKTLEIEVK